MEPLLLAQFHPEVGIDKAKTAISKEASEIILKNFKTAARTYHVKKNIINQLNNTDLGTLLGKRSSQNHPEISEIKQHEKIDKKSLIHSSVSPR